jgi:phenylpropionate dioxygenase-like ring-hydroxylating dioxygenase large terminal subunit
VIEETQLFITNSWYCVERASEMSTLPFERIVCNEPIVFFQTAKSGILVALENRCPHRQAPLSMGKVVGDEIMCIYHGWTMNSSGACTHVPHQVNVSSNAAVKSYPIIEKWGFVWVWIGEPVRADQALIPEMPWLVAEDRSAVLSRFYVKANYQLMADNLLDVSHSDFLHASSFGSQAGKKGETDKVRQTLEITSDNSAVRCVRTLRDVELSPMAAAWGGFSRQVTRTHRQKWSPPNTVNIELIMENDENKITINHDHIMTPETETTCHYLFGFTRDYNLDKGYPNDADVRREQEGVIGAEDVPMVEAQQHNKIRFGDPLDIPGQADKFLIAVHKRIAEMAG